MNGNVIDVFPSAKVAVATPQISPSAVVSVAPLISRRVALVIGNGRYQHAAQLPNPPNDAADIALALRKLGFDVVEGRDLGKREMEDKISRIRAQARTGGPRLLFYAGHGMQVAGRNYLVPVDAKLERAGDLSLDTIEVGRFSRRWQRRSG